jgi:hypothetical protein
VALKDALEEAVNVKGDDGVAELLASHCHDVLKGAGSSAAASSSACS